MYMSCAPLASGSSRFDLGVWRGLDDIRDKITVPVSSKGCSACGRKAVQMSTTAVNHLPRVLPVLVLV